MNCYITRCELHKHYVFPLTQPLFVIITSNTTRFDQTEHHQVVVYTKTQNSQRKNVILRRLTNHIKYKLHTLVILNKQQTNNKFLITKVVSGRIRNVSYVIPRVLDNEMDSVKWTLVNCCGHTLSAISDPAGSLCGNHTASTKPKYLEKNLYTTATYSSGPTAPPPPTVGHGIITQASRSHSDTSLNTTPLGE